MVDRRPSIVDPMVAEARQRGAIFASSPSVWTVDDVPGPDVTDKETVLTMALIAADAYVEKPGMPDWEEVGEPFNRTEDFGWETDGLRGHIWGDETNSTIVIGLKGTSPAVFDGEGTTTNDKENDNLFFSCCCAQQGQWSWHQAARELYANVTELYPESNIWIAGHSLGGAYYFVKDTNQDCYVQNPRMVGLSRRDYNYGIRNDNNNNKLVDFDLRDSWMHYLFRYYNVRDTWLVRLQ
ncbi:putative autophagy related lipase protein [Eutypa lata UCREL1]|uniref:triacylglycerol lipase n=1 Tax=Eutypa lata (strain UCR-EL1) TaxID=1287681 RepID=M7T2H5_EUTLA|nr:putative autophagy related lipase protein [Eutypa lata UCREL1]